MGYKIYKSLDEVNNYIHSYGPNIPDEHKYIGTKNNIYVYDKEDVLNNWRVFYYPYEDKYIICKTKFDYQLQCDLFNEKYNKHKFSNEESIAWANARGRYIIHQNTNSDKPIIGSIMEECFDPSYGTNFEATFVPYKRNVLENNVDTKDIRVFPGKIKFFTKNIGKAFIMAGFKEISNDRGTSYQIKGCNEDEINYWISCCKKYGLNYKINESQFTRSESYRDDFFRYAKPVVAPKYNCEFCGKKRSLKFMVPVDLIPQSRLENDFDAREMLFESKMNTNLNEYNKGFACKKCAILKGDSIRPWNFFYEQTKIGGWYALLRYIFRRYIRFWLIFFIILSALTILGELEII